MERAAGPLADGLKPFVQLFIAMWDESRGGTAWVLCSEAGTFGAAYQPGTIRQVERVLTPLVPHDLCPDARFDPRKHGVGIAQAMRGYRDEVGIGRVGGRAELTVVDAAGVRTEVLCEWPDKVGKRIA